MLRTSSTHTLNTRVHQDTRPNCSIHGPFCHAHERSHAGVVSPHSANEPSGGGFLGCSIPPDRSDGAKFKAARLKVISVDKVKTATNLVEEQCKLSCGDWEWFRVVEVRGRKVSAEFATENSAENCFLLIVRHWIVLVRAFLLGRGFGLELEASDALRCSRRWNLELEVDRTLENSGYKAFKSPIWLSRMSCA